MSYHGASLGLAWLTTIIEDVRRHIGSRELLSVSRKNGIVVKDGSRYWDPENGLYRKTFGSRSDPLITVSQPWEDPIHNPPFTVFGSLKL